MSRSNNGTDKSSRAGILFLFGSDRSSMRSSIVPLRLDITGVSCRLGFPEGNSDWAFQRVTVIHPLQLYVSYYHEHYYCSTAVTRNTVQTLPASQARARSCPSSVISSTLLYCNPFDLTTSTARSSFLLTFFFGSENQGMALVWNRIGKRCTLHPTNPSPFVVQNPDSRYTRSRAFPSPHQHQMAPRRQ